MTTTLRQFSRNFSRLRRAAANGREILVRDPDGATYVFKRVDGVEKRMGDLVGHLAGSVRTGKSVKSLVGYGRR